MIFLQAGLFSLCWCFYSVKGSKHFVFHCLQLEHDRSSISAAAMTVKAGDPSHLRQKVQKAFILEAILLIDSAHTHLWNHTFEGQQEFFFFYRQLLLNKVN